MDKSIGAMIADLNTVGVVAGREMRFGKGGAKGCLCCLNIITLTYFNIKI